MINALDRLIDQPLGAHLSDDPVDARLRPAIALRQSFDRHAAIEAPQDFFFHVLGERLRRVREDGRLRMLPVVVLKSIPDRFHGPSRFAGNAAADLGRASAYTRKATGADDDLVPLLVRHLAEVSS